MPAAPKRTSRKPKSKASTKRPKSKASTKRPKSKASTKRPKSKTSTKRKTVCEQMYTKKYTSPSRLSPPYPATPCAGTTKKGNDGRMWTSKVNVVGIWTWRPVA